MKDAQRYNNESMFQFTHPQGVRYGRGCLHSLRVVSIHAPARGAIAMASQQATQYEFQFTHPQGVRSSFYAVCDVLVVSIHAPARGAM